MPGDEVRHRLVAVGLGLMEGRIRPQFGGRMVGGEHQGRPRRVDGGQGAAQDQGIGDIVGMELVEHQQSGAGQQVVHRLGEGIVGTGLPGGGDGPV